MPILVKNASHPAAAADGARVLLERRRPRGLKTEALALRAWLRPLAPSEKLQQWFDERPRQWLIFRRRYLAELGSDAAIEALIELHSLAAAEPVTTLLTHAGEPERSHCAILRDLLEGSRKPPSSTGPVRAAARIRASARRKP